MEQHTLSRRQSERCLCVRAQRRKGRFHSLRPNLVVTMTFAKMFALLLLAPSLGERLVESSLSEELGQPLDVILDKLDLDDDDLDMNSTHSSLSVTLNPGCPAPLCSSPNVTVANLTSPQSGEDNDDRDDHR